MTITKASNRARRIAAQHFRLQARHAERLAKRIRRYHLELARRVAERFLRTEAGLRLDGESLAQKTSEPELLVTEQDKRILQQLLVAAERAMWDDSQNLVAEILPIEPVPLLGEVEERIGQRVTRITEVTRSQIARVIDDGFSAGLSDVQIAEDLRTVVEETYRGRADTIARTEIAMVDSEATVNAYQQVGVTHVLVSDGLDCGWTSHDDPDKADGSTRSLEAWQARPIAHPNCVRSAAPLEPQ